jgi:polygalacturonase
MTACKTFTLAALLLLTPLANAKTCDPHTFGAKADGVTPDTAALQKAIDTCSAAGSSIELTAGTYLSAPLTLHSHTHLVLDKDAVLLGSSNVDDYPVRTEPISKWRRTALIHADGVNDISITGAGTIDGAGKVWWDISHKSRVAGDTTGSGIGFTRPQLVDIVDSTQIVFDGITLQNSPMYNIALFGSSYIAITNVKIHNPPSPNTDGIDPFWSSHIKIDHVTWDTGDDCVAIKSGLVERGEPDIPSSDISITNSECMHGHGISIGSELAGGAHDITVDNVNFTGTDAGIRIKSNRGRGNDIYNLHYSNIKMTNVKIPIQIVEYYPNSSVPEPSIPGTDPVQPLVKHTPRFHDITIKSVTATGAITAMQIIGLPESPIKGLVLENVDIAADKSAKIQNVELTEKNVVLKVTANPAMIQGEGVKLWPAL